MGVGGMSGAKDIRPRGIINENALPSGKGARMREVTRLRQA